MNIVTVSKCKFRSLADFTWLLWNPVDVHSECWDFVRDVQEGQKICISNWRHIASRALGCLVLLNSSQQKRAQWSHVGQYGLNLIKFDLEEQWGAETRNNFTHHF